MRTPTLLLCLLLIVVSSSYAQVIPINHNMRNLKSGNSFIYRGQITTVRPSSSETIYRVDRVVRYDTVNNKQYAVFQNGYRERADSSGVYGIPLNFYTREPFTQEYLRYPFFTGMAKQVTLLYCSIMSSICFPANDTIYPPINATITPSGVNSVLGFSVLGFFFVGGNYQTDYAETLGPWRSLISSGNERSITTLCGAVIEGKYYGDSACLVASSTPLRGEEFTSFSASLAPNPATDISTIRFILPTAQGLTVEVRDMLGREVVSPLVFDALSSGMNAIPIDVSSLPRGVYALRLRSTLGLRATTMFVKE